MKVAIAIATPAIPLTGGGAARNMFSSELTWDASSDTYSQAIYTEQSSQLTWDASTDTYSQSVFS